MAGTDEDFGFNLGVVVGALYGERVFFNLFALTESVSRPLSLRGFEKLISERFRDQSVPTVIADSGLRKECRMLEETYK